MTRCSIQPRTREYVIKGYSFLSFARNLSKKYGRNLLDATTKTGPDPAKTASKKLSRRRAEATRELIRNKIAEKM